MGTRLLRAQLPNFRPMSIVDKRLYVSWIPLSTEVGLSPGDIVLDGDSAAPAPTERRKAALPPLFGTCLL